jgi:hypothetical protein
MSTSVTVSKDEIGEKAFDIATLIGLLDENGDLQTDWFSSPLTQLEAAPGRAKTLIQSIQSFLGPRAETNAPVFTGAEWYEIRNPSTGNATGFYVVTPPAADAGGLVGLGIQHAIAVGNLSIDFYVFIPVFRINNGHEPDFVLIDTTNPGKVSPVRVGFDVSSTVPLDAGNGGTFTDFKVEGDISLDGKASDLFALAIAFTGGTMTDGDTYHALTNFINASTTGDRMATLIVQGMSYWLNLYIGSSEHTIGDVLVNANLLGTGTSGNFTYYSYDANALRKIKADPLRAAEDILCGVLEVLTDNETPLIPLPFLDPKAQGDGGVYITETERDGAKDYGLRIVAEIPFISGNGTDGKPQAAGDVCFGTWLTGETSGNNWIERTAGKGTLPEPGLSFLFLNRGADGTLSFAPSFVLTSIGLNVKGGAKSPLINLNGYTLNGADLRFYLNPEGQLNNPGAWQYGFAIRLDDVGLPLAPKTGTGGAGGNPVAQNLLSSGSDDGKQSEGADHSTINPPFSAAIAWRSDSTNDPKYNFQLFDKDENPTDKVWLPVQRAFGPLHCQRLGIGWQQPNPDFLLAFLFDGDVALAGLEVDLEGLAVGIPLGAPGDLSKYRLDLDGLDFTFAEGSVEISGGLFKTPASVNGQKIVEYNGEALLKAGTWSVSAVGSWTTLSGHPSLFIFAFLDANIGGPAFFYVTGLSAGFGYNRSLKLPTQDQVAAFPLVAGLTNPSQIGGPSATPGQALQALQDWVPPAQGCYWLAAGVRFTTFELVNSNALIVVEFGKNFEIAILGLARARLPQTGSEVFAYLELGLEIIIDPEDGLVSFTAVVTPNSFVLDPGCHLTGGFAFFAWFGKNLHAGDFVITLGGYHTYFNKPDWYPDEPRLGFHWQLSDQVSISGDAYFALTPSCVMGGGSLDAEFHSGSLSAWFKARADFLMQWKPFYFLVEIGVDMGVALQTDLLFVKVTLKIELGADLSLWGPPVGGLVQVHLWICTITIGFGPPFGQGNDYLPFNEFHTLLPQDEQKKPRPTTSRATESAPAPLKNVVKLVINRGLVAQTGTDGRWLVRADEFVFSVETTFPLTQLDLTGPDGKTTPIPPPPLAQQDKDAPGCARLSDGYYVGVRPMGINCALSELTLAVGDEHKVYQDLNKDWLWTATTQAVPEALWGKAVPKDATPTAVAKTLPGRFAGLQGLAPRMVVPDGAPPIPKQNLSDDPVNPGNENYLPFPQAPQTNQPKASVTSLKTIADTLTAQQPTENRKAIFSALAAFGYNAGNNGDLSALAANVNRSYLAAPLLGSPVTPSRSNK